MHYYNLVRISKEKGEGEDEVDDYDYDEEDDRTLSEMDAKVEKQLRFPKIDNE